MSKSTIHTACPQCGKSFELDASTEGQKGRCDECETKFIIAPVVKSGDVESAGSKGNGPMWVTLLFLLGIGGYFAYDKMQVKAVTSSGEKPNSVEVKQQVNVEPAKSTEVEKPSDVKVAEPEEKLAVSFPVKETFSQIDIREYQSTYPNVHQGWMPNGVEQAEEAKSWGNYLGPLGVRIRSHVPQLQNRGAFAAIVPRSISSADGTLALTAAEVVSIAPGSPADGHLQVGDLIVGIEGEMLKSGNNYRPDWKFMHKDARELQLMLGEKIDEAQGRGDVRLTVMRYPMDSEEKFVRDLKSTDGKISSEKIAVQAGDEIHLIVDPKGVNDFDHLAWLSPELSGAKGTLDLADEAQIKPIEAATGWGNLTYGKDLVGNPLNEKGFTVHAESRVVFQVPEGYDSFQTGALATSDKGELQVKVVIAKKQEHLPVFSKELWSGQGGNESVGAQTFDVEVPSDGYITLVSDKFDGEIHGDGTMWMDVVVEGDYGTKKLLSMRAESMVAGYGRPGLVTDKPTDYKGQTYSESLNIHAHGSAKWHLPKGTKRIKGSFVALSYGKVQPKIYHTNLALPITGIHKDKLVDLRFPIGKVGSYSATYPKDCEKSKRTVTRHTEWLAAQQREDGSWPRLAGYTTDGWDTAWCGLALMSSGDSKYDEQVKKAAYRVAYQVHSSEWIAERSMRLIFLSEYYLRTKDDKIVAGIQAAYEQVIDCCKTDFMAGHKVNGFGYGIAGQHYGTGHLALSIALAKQTPIEVDKKLVDGIIRHAGEVCVNGHYAYGRGRRMARDDSREHSGGNAMSGPGVLGVQIGGGHASAVKELAERMDASIGDGDNSHATSSLAYIFGSLAIAAADEEVYLKHMQNFKYKMTIDDNWDGGYLKSAFPLDFQGGEGVTSSWIRTAGYILVMNALEKNMAITGKRELWSKDKIETVAVSEWGGQVHSYYLRNWCLANELLGSKAPKMLQNGIVKMHGLPRTLDLVPETRKVIEQVAPSIIDRLMKDTSLKAEQRAYAIELLCGLDFKIYAEQKGNSEEVKLSVNYPFHQLNWLDKDKADMFQKSSLAMNSVVEISADNLAEVIKFETKGTEGFNLDQGTRDMSVNKPLKNSGQKEFDGVAKIQFNLGEHKVSYDRPLKFNTEFAHSNNYNLRRLKLKLKVAPRAIFQSQPLVISGLAFDCMYPAERMMEIEGPEGVDVNAHEGSEVWVDLSSENFICAWVHRLILTEPTQVKVFKAASHTNIKGSYTGDIESLYDLVRSTTCDFKSDGESNLLEYDFGKEVTLNGLDMNYDGSSFVRVWCQQGEKWVPVVWDTYSANTGHRPTFADVTASKWRVEIIHGGQKRIQTLRFYHNPNRVSDHPKPIQLSNPKYIPELVK